ncbi:MAG TPA: adenylate/guanylate cyclase domain-containing protein [Burkholderiales bacterium]|nr:adenylate/guanylate cyclase domain-containing protein [Burkholderiales bacterium]
MRLLRLSTGLVVALFVVGHFLNHALGVVSIEAMDRMRVALALWWRSPPGTVLLYGALLIHFVLALISLYRRSTLRMPAWEAAQLILGLSIPPLLIAHVVGTRLTWMLLGHNIDYERIVGLLWSSDWGIARQSLLLLIVWAHACAGLHYWLRVRQWYRNLEPLAFAVALLLPAIALAGFTSAGFYLWPSVESVGGMQKYNVDLAGMSDAERTRMAAWRSGLEWAFWIALAATLLARWLRTRIGATYQVRHVSGRVITAPVGRSILEAIRDEGLPHASVCGGRARCTTCRVRVSGGLEHLPPAGRMEAQALGRIQAPPNVRLACQCRPTRDVAVAPLLPPNAGPSSARRAQSESLGRERRIVAVFVDLRDSTHLAEGRLPYDVVFIMNQFFAEMHAALRATGGYYAQFRGDGLLALYGLQSALPAACRAALEGAAQMQERIEQLNRSLAVDLPSPLRIGIGIHAGVAIVGTLGPPDAPIYSAIGDMVNTAARFEDMTKAFGCTLVVSAEALRQAGIEPAQLSNESPQHQVRVRGKTERLTVYAVADPRTLIQGRVPLSVRES